MSKICRALLVNKDHIISDIFLWTSTCGYTSIGWPAKTYIHQLCPNNWCHPEELIRSMFKWDGRGKTVNRILDVSTTWLWLWWWFFWGKAITDVNELLFIYSFKKKEILSNISIYLVQKFCNYHFFIVIITYGLFTSSDAICISCRRNCRW